jgi:hypothetical protein
MAVRTQCPRCKQPLSVPNKLAGSYASCPRCQGRFWVSKDAPIDPSAGDSSGMLPVSTLTLTEAPLAIPPVPGPPARVSSPAVAASAVAPPRQYFPSVTLQPLMPAAPPVSLPAAVVPAIPLPPVEGAANGSAAAPPQTRKIARLVSADSAQSTLKLAADGQLPNLQLQEGDEKGRGQGKTRSVSPLVVIGAWVFSVVLSVAMVIMISGGDDSSVTTQAKRIAMAKIEEHFFGDPARGELLPYQRLLRGARQARARGDVTAERQYYKQVLDLLHTENVGGASQAATRSRLEKGITGSRDRDGELERLILDILKE